MIKKYDDMQFCPVSIAQTMILYKTGILSADKITFSSDIMLKYYTHSQIKEKR